MVISTFNFLGTIIISIDFVKEKKGKEYGHSEEDELNLLFIHGLFASFRI